MKRLLYAREFTKSFSRLPASVKKSYKELEKLLAQDHTHPRLHLKKLKGEKFVFSFRITREYRALFTFIDDTSILLLTIGHRKDVYK